MTEFKKAGFVIIYARNIHLDSTVDKMPRKEIKSNTRVSEGRNFFVKQNQILANVINIFNSGF